MKNWKLIAAYLCLAAPAALIAAESELPIDIYNRLRIEHDDNINTSLNGADAEDSLKIIEELELLFDTELDNTYLGVRYSPSFVYYDDREGDDSDLHHQLDLILDQRLSPRSSLRIKETLRISENPELIEDGVVVRNSNDFLYNSLNAAFETQLVPEKTTLRVDGRYAVVAYDDSSIASVSDYNSFVAGLGVSQRISPTTTVGGEGRYTTTDYDDNLRSADSVQVGLTGQHAFSPKLRANARAGVESRSVDGAAKSDSENPYVSCKLIFLPASSTRVSLGAGWSMDKSPVRKYAQQERVRVFGALAQKLTPAISLNIAGSVSQGTYDLEDATSALAAGESDGDETITSVSTTVSYAVNVSNWIELAWQYIELSSDIRAEQDYERNRVSLGWKVQL